jgi:hypothetical protein
VPDVRFCWGRSNPLVGESSMNLFVAVSILPESSLMNKLNSVLQLLNFLSIGYT